MPLDDSNGGQEKLFPWSPLLTGLVLGVAVVTILGLSLTPLVIRQWPVLNQTEKQGIKFLLGLFFLLVIVVSAIDLLKGKQRDSD
jgi:xanthine/uracil permease